jgi:hypothetical protein
LFGLKKAICLACFLIGDIRSKRALLMQSLHERSLLNKLERPSSDQNQAKPQEVDLGNSPLICD